MTAPDVRPPSAGQAGPLRIGELQTNGTIRFGNLSVGKPMAGLTSLRFDLLLEPTSDGWQLDITGPETPGSATKPASLGKVALSRQKSAAASPTLSAALVPVARDSALLVLKWGDVTATAGVQFQEVQLPPRRPAAGGRRRPSIGITTTRTSARAQTMLSQMNEAALVDAQGARFSVTFARTFPKGTASQSAAGTTRQSGARRRRSRFRSADVDPRRRRRRADGSARAPALDRPGRAVRETGPAPGKSDAPAFPAPTACGSSAPARAGGWSSTRSRTSGVRSAIPSPTSAKST